MSEKHTKKRVHIALLMMVKNEHKRLHVTLDSVKGYVNSVILYDTGSEDDTIDIARNFCEKENIPFHLKEGEFVDFSTSRNVSLEFADTVPDVDYLLLMDTNDELRGGNEMRENCQYYLDKKNTGFLVSQEWWSGVYDKYYNVRLVKARQGWRYFGRVHEWPKNTRYESDEEAQKDGDSVIRLDSVILYQDRTQDDDKTGKRFSRDAKLLLEDHKDDPTEPRTVFYLAQTYSCLNNISESFYYYKLRTTLPGFWEERFHAHLRCGDLSEKLNHPWEESLKWYMKALELWPRAEPAVKIAQHYRDKNWLLCYTFSDLACNLRFPDEAILFIDKMVYDYKRWELLGIAGWYSGFRDRGKIGCINALKTGIHPEVNKKNMGYYEQWENEKNGTGTMTRKEFVDKKMMELIEKQPSLSKKQAISQARRMWQKRR